MTDETSGAGESSEAYVEPVIELVTEADGAVFVVPGISVLCPPGEHAVSDICVS